MAERSPVGEPFKVGSGLAEELKLHLLELPTAEDEVTGSDLVTEGLTNLRDTEGELLSRCSLNVYEVSKDTLCGLGTEINGVLCVLGYALEGLEHKVELTDIREIVLAAGGTGNVVLLNEVLHFALLECVDRLGKLKIVFLAPILDDLVRAKTLVTLLAVHERVGETADVTRGDPGLRVHEDGGIKADVIFILLHELTPPGGLYVVFELDAQRAELTGVGQTAVDLTAGEDKAATFAQGNDLFHSFFGVLHDILPLVNIII